MASTCFPGVEGGVTLTGRLGGGWGKKPQPEALWAQNTADDRDAEAMMDSRLCPPLLHLWLKLPSDAQAPAWDPTSTGTPDMFCLPLPNRLAARLWGHEDAAETVLVKDLANW